MKLLLFITLFTFLSIGCSAPEPAPFQPGPEGSPAEVLSEISRAIPQISAPLPTDDLLGLLPAYFSADNAERPRELAYADFYLFPDHTYYFSKRSHCFLSMTIDDNGRWELNDGVVELKSDGLASYGDPLRDRRYVPFFLTVGGERILLLIGTKWGYWYFKENSPGYVRQMLFMCSISRHVPVGPREGDNLGRRFDRKRE